MRRSDSGKESGLGKLARRTLDAIRKRRKSASQGASKTGAAGSIIGGAASASQSAGQAVNKTSAPTSGSSASDIATAGAGAATSAISGTDTGPLSTSGPNMDAGSHYDTSRSRSGATPSTTTPTTSGPNMDAGSHYDTSRSRSEAATPATTDAAIPAAEEEFVGSGGVGSPEFLEALRKGHEAAGGEYTSDLREADERDKPLAT